jgi:hypothetical protein
MFIATPHIAFGRGEEEAPASFRLRIFGGIDHRSIAANGDADDSNEGEPS